MKVSIRPDHCIALRLIASQEHYRKSQDWLNMVPEWERLVEVAEQSQIIIKMQAAEIEKLRAALKPFAAVVNDKTKSLDDDYYLPDCFRMGDLRAAAAALKETGQ